MKSSTSWLNRQELERELQTISSYRAKSSTNKSSIFSRLNNVWQRLVLAIAHSSELQVWQTTDRQGNTWWNAYDPKTERSTCLASEAEMRIWIEQLYYQ